MTNKVESSTPANTPIPMGPYNQIVDADFLKREMARLKRNCYRLIWLNRLLGTPDYESLTRGIQAARPNDDPFLPVQNLASFEDLAIRPADLNQRSNGGNHARYSF